MLHIFTTIISELRSILARSQKVPSMEHPTISSALLNRATRAVFCRSLEKLDNLDLAWSGAWIALLPDGTVLSESVNRETALVAIRGELLRRRGRAT